MARRANGELLLFLGGDYKLDFVAAQLAAARDAYVMCADGGAEPLYRLGRPPDMVVGDFDSLSNDAYAWLIDKGVHIRYKRSQCLTDGEFAVYKAARLRPDRIIVYGGRGRPDHEWTNVTILENLLGKSECWLRDEESETVLVSGRSGKADIRGRTGDTVSLLPVSATVSGIKAKGLRWRPPGGRLYRCQSRGMCNIMTADFATVSVQRGILQIIHIFP